MSDNHATSRLTQSFLGLPDDAFRAVPGLEKVLADTLNKYIDVHHVSTGTVMTALAFMVGEMIVTTGGEETEQSKQWFLKILDAYISTGKDGARVGPDHEPSLVRRLRPWRGGE
jgi:hypothetical protein